MIAILPHFHPSPIRAEAISSEPLLPESTSLGLFEIPSHLRTAWRDAADEVVSRKDRQGAGFESFVGRLAEFLRYKRVPLAESSRFDVIAADGGSLSVVPEGSGEGGIRWLALNLGEGDVEVVRSADATKLGATLAPGQGVSIPAGAAIACEHRGGKGEAMLILRICPDAATPSVADGPGTRRERASRGARESPERDERDSSRDTAVVPTCCDELKTKGVAACSTFESIECGSSTTAASSPGSASSGTTSRK